jgi:hypothetical protein
MARLSVKAVNRPVKKDPQRISWPPDDGPLDEPVDPQVALSIEWALQTERALYHRATRTKRENQKLALAEEILALLRTE